MSKELVDYLEGKTKMSPYGVRDIKETKKKKGNKKKKIIKAIKKGLNNLRENYNSMESFWDD